jgi:hypothetical protein
VKTSYIQTRIREENKILILNMKLIRLQDRFSKMSNGPSARKAIALEMIQTNKEIKNRIQKIGEMNAIH